MKVNNDTEPPDAPVPFVDFEPLILLKENRHGLKLAVLLATRGTLFSLAIESILREIQEVTGWEIALFFSHDKKIPDGVNGLVNRALAWGAYATWLVEEDNYMQHNVLRSMLGLLDWYDVISCDYYNHQGTAWELTGQLGPIPFYAFGCTLVNARVWRKIGLLDISKIPHWNYSEREIYYQDGTQYGYGGQDVDFCVKVWQNGFTSHRLPHNLWRCGHMHIEKAGQLRVNDGCHTVKIQ